MYFVTQVAFGCIAQHKFEPLDWARPVGEGRGGYSQSSAGLLVESNLSLMNQNSIRVSITALPIIQCPCMEIVLAHEDDSSVKKVNTEKPFLAENFVSMSHFKFLFPVLPVSV